MCEENNNLNTFLLNEIETNKKEIWSKLKNALKNSKLKEYIDNDLKVTHTLNDVETLNAHNYILGLLEKKIITKNNDVIYNKDSEKLEKINNLFFNIQSRNFFFKKEKKTSITTTLRKQQKRNNTSQKRRKRVKEEKN